jgi:hypothetical protein
MGREATCLASDGTQQAEVKALLESTSLVLRGALRRHWALASLQGIRAEGEQLCFEVGGEPVRLQLGAAAARSWATKMLAPPPSLAAKLGIGAERPACVIGRVDDAALAQALQGAQTAKPQQAACVLAVLRAPADLQSLLGRLPQLPPVPLWVVHGKGRVAAVGDAQVRSALRELGYVDNKTSAVSVDLTATRYARPAARR